MTKQIQLTKGFVALVDDADYEWLSRQKWQASWNGGNWYAVKTDVIGTMYMHRAIANAPSGSVVDHVDGNTLNNQRCNLRTCSQSENMQNRGKTKTNTSGYKGVTWHRNRNKFLAQIKVNNKNIYLGYFKSAEDAARAYDEAAKKHHGAFAYYNFREV
jgi:hypothetical protein